jgi:AmmeMemoRadiSam system protein B/AmmeMemoRadiSam system protein A
MAEELRVRKAAVAGSFYPDDPEQLRASLNTMLAQVDAPAPPGRPLLIVAPHAGYMFSGTVAAHGYKLLLERPIKTVVVISPSHIEHFSHIAVFDGDAYETPLGTIAVDKTLVEAIVSADPLIKKSSRGHVQSASRGEHAIEVQLPFLQAVLPGCAIVPIVMGDQRWEFCSALGQALAPLAAREDIVFVASSDLSHFHPDGVARAKDALFLERLAAMDAKDLYHAVESESCEACGAGPIIAGIIAASSAAACECRILSTANSGDVTGDPSQVVGYAAAVALDTSPRYAIPNSDKSEFSLNNQERRYLLARARRSIETSLGSESVNTEPAPTTPAMNNPRGGFITLKIRKRLRGCIGRIEGSGPLPTMVEDMAKAAAFDDPRFPQLEASELKDLHIEISVLSPLRDAFGPADIEVGRHGLVVERGTQRGLLLPQVAVEQKWDAVTFLEQTSCKAGLNDDAWTHADTSVFTFTAVVFAEDE